MCVYTQCLKIVIYISKVKQFAYPFVGLEIVADLKNCPIELLTTMKAKDCMPALSALIQRHGLTELGKFTHDFDIGFTGIIALAESHIAVHTWPNEQYVSLNIHVCNYTQDNSARARSLFNDIQSIFQPDQVAYQEIQRSFT